MLFLKMIDFHNHILPNVDDGPKNMDESISMLKHAKKIGITDIVQTIHFQHPKMEGKNTNYEYIKNIRDNLIEQAKNEKLNIRIHLSSEVFYLPNLDRILSNPLTTCGNGKFMLIEFSSSIFPFGYEEEFFKLQLKNITPIVAHPERYRFIQNDLNILFDWLNKGFVVQVDAGSILGNFGNNVKKTVFKMIDMNCIHLIGSDCHNNRNRNFCLDKAYDIISSDYSIEVVDKLKNNSKKLLNGENLNNILFTNKNNDKFFLNKLFKLFK
tara:strand:- start:1137 stop:1940 length:804 start_codon:yes stop_codon:yes gene_type:complete